MRRRGGGGRRSVVAGSCVGACVGGAAVVGATVVGADGPLAPTGRHTSDPGYSGVSGGGVVELEQLVEVEVGGVGDAQPVVAGDRLVGVGARRLAPRRPRATAPARRLVVVGAREADRRRRTLGQADRAAGVDRRLGGRLVDLEQRVERRVGCRRRCAPSSRRQRRCTGWCSRGRRAQRLVAPPSPSSASSASSAAASSAVLGTEIGGRSRRSEVLGVDGRRDDDDIGGAVVRCVHRRRPSSSTARRSRAGLVTVAAVAEGAEQRDGEHDGEDDGADAEHAGIDGAERAEASGDRRRRLEPHRRAVIELLERLLAAHDVVGAGAFRRTCRRTRSICEVRSGSNCRLVPEGVVVVEVVAHACCWWALAGRRQGHRSSTGRHQIATLAKKWKCSTCRATSSDAAAPAAAGGRADTIVPTFGEVAESGRTRLPAKEVTAARWSVGSNPTLSAQPHRCAQRFGQATPIVGGLR